MHLVAFRLVNLCALCLELFLRGSDLFSVTLRVLFEPLHARRSPIDQRLSLLANFSCGELQRGRRLKKFQVWFVQFASQRRRRGNRFGGLLLRTRRRKHRQINDQLCKGQGQKFGGESVPVCHTPPHAALSLDALARRSSYFSGLGSAVTRVTSNSTAGLTRIFSRENCEIYDCNAARVAAAPLVLGNPKRKVAGAR